MKVVKRLSKRKDIWCTKFSFSPFSVSSSKQLRSHGLQLESHARKPFEVLRDMRCGQLKGARTRIIDSTVLKFHYAREQAENVISHESADPATR